MKCALSLLVIAAIAMIAGCGGSYDGPPLGTVSGKVTIDGKPATDAIVTFKPLDGGRSSSGTTDKEGNYQLVFTTTRLGAQVGKHEVTLSGDQVLGESPNMMNPKTSVPPEITEMTREVEVESGSNTIDLEYP